MLIKTAVEGKANIGKMVYALDDGLLTVEEMSSESGDRFKRFVGSIGLKAISPIYKKLRSLSLAGHRPMIGWIVDEAEMGLEPRPGECMIAIKNDGWWYPHVAIKGDE